MPSLGRLFVVIGAETAGFDTSMKSAEQRVQSLGKEMNQNIKDAAKYAASITAVGTAIGTALVAQSLNAARETQNLARIANTTTREFRAMAYAAEGLGIDGGKLADIFKDMNDRVGDFIQTGAGPMTDFFEQIAPQVGVTAEQFARLSGPEALQLYVNSLEQANLNQSDMTFYMEAIASDSTALLPLLRNNGQAMAEQAAAAEQLGYALSDIDYQTMAEARQSIQELGGAVIGVRDRIVAELSPHITALAEQIKSQFLAAGDSMEDSIGGAVNSAVAGFARILDAAASTVDYVSDNPATAKFGLIGLLVWGSRGAAIGTAIGAVFELIRDQMESLGIGIDDTEFALNRNLELVQRIGNEQRLKKKYQEEIDLLATQQEEMGSLSMHEQARMNALVSGLDRQERKIQSLMAEQAAANDELYNSEESVARLNELLAESDSNAGGLANSLRGASAALLESLAAVNESGGGIDIPDANMPDTDGESSSTRLTATEREEIEKRLEDLRNSYLTEFEIIEQNEAEKLALLEQARAADKDMVQDYDELKTQIEKEGAEKRKEIQRQELAAKLDIASKMFGNLSSLMETESRELFNIGKVAAIAQATVDGIQATISSYRYGAAIGGPVLGAAFATTAAVATGVQISKLMSTTYGGGGSVSAPSSGGAAAPAAPQAAPAQSGPDRTLRIERLNPDDQVSGQSVNNLLDEVSSWLEDGGQLVA